MTRLISHLSTALVVMIILPSFCDALLHFAPHFLHQKNVDIDSSRTEMFQYKTLHRRTKVDHFGWSNQRYYQMRYLVADQFWDTKGPIFFYTGNEGDIEWFCNNTGFMWDIAPKYKALLVFAEHRYYGKSMPYGNKSYENIEVMQYFTSEQALADFAELITYLWGEYNVKVPVIAFGGSYGGMLTAWFRMKYPHLVAGGIAASAPIWQFTGITKCNVYNQIVTKDYELANKNCPNNIRNSWKLLSDLAATDDGRSQINSKFNLCKKILQPSDVDLLKSFLVDLWGSMAMMNYPYPASFMATLPAWPVKVACKSLSTPDLAGSELLSGLVIAASVFYNYTGDMKCLNPNQQATTALGDLGWDFQSCTEMVMPMCTDGKTDMFEPSAWDYNAYSVRCRKVWNVIPDSTWIKTHYADKHIQAASNIVFSNGGLDPWSGGGVLTNISASVNAVWIPDGAHHLDLRSSNPADPPSVIAARRFHEEKIKEWINASAKNNRDGKLRFIPSR